MANKSIKALDSELRASQRRRFINIADQWRITTFRLTVLFGILFTAAVIVLLGFIYWKTAVYLDSQVESAVDGMARTYTQMSHEELLERIEYAVVYDVRHINMIGLFDNDGNPLAGNLRYLPTALQENGGISQFTYESSLRHVLLNPIHNSSIPVGIPSIDSQSIQKLNREQISGTAIARLVRLPSGEQLVLGRDITQSIEVRRVIEKALIAGGSGILLLGLAGGFALAVRPLRRINAIREITQQIMRGDLSLRIPNVGQHDELDMLATTVNQMLDEISRLLAEVKSVTDTIAHDLRTPLTRLRALLYRTLQESDLDVRQHAMFEQAVAETDTLLRRFRALLRIAEIENRERRAGFSAVNIAAVAEQIFELFEPLAEEKNVQLRKHIVPVASIPADPDLLFEALSNLVDNAIKFTPAGGFVELQLSAGEAGPCIDIRDSGPGVLVSERKVVLQRFYRSDRNSDVAGVGLGLSIVAAVVLLHSFKLEFQDSEQGTHLRLYCWPHSLA